jgi:hypothetical protein
MLDRQLETKTGAEEIQMGRGIQSKTAAYRQNRKMKTSNQRARTARENQRKMN